MFIDRSITKLKDDFNREEFNDENRNYQFIY